MTDETFTVAGSAELLGISGETLRRWCNQFGSHLSAGASPGKGIERKFTQYDLRLLAWAKKAIRDGQSWRYVDKALPLVTESELPAWADLTGLQQDTANESTALDTPGRLMVLLEKLADSSTAQERQQAELGQVRNELAELRAEVEALKTASTGTTGTAQRVSFWDRLTGRKPPA